MSVKGYCGQVLEVRPILAAMEDRGLPIDDAERLKLDAEFDAAQQELGTELAMLAPLDCHRVYPKHGYKTVPPEIKLFEKHHVEPFDPVMRFKESGDSPEWYSYDRREFQVATVDATSGEPVSILTTRWCRVYDFNPNSWQQLLVYMKVKGHPVPKSRKKEDADGNAKATTEKKELVRLAHKTGDTFYLKVIEYRELSKMRGTYIGGFRPGLDGRVHTTFTFDTGTGQLSSRNPNIQNFPKHGRLAGAVRRMVAAPEGSLIVEADFKSYHVLTTGFEAEDALYMRMARLDMHSFVAGCVLGCWKPTIVDESDDALADRFKWFKQDADRKRVRDKQAKPTILGVGFGMKYRRLYQENMEHFAGEKEAKKFWYGLADLFPLTICQCAAGHKCKAWQHRIRDKAHDDKKLVSRFGHIRRFYEVYMWDNRHGYWGPGDQAEEAVAFLPANHAFGNIRETMKELRRLGHDATYGLCNNVHDSFVFVFPEAQLDSFIGTVVPVLRAPSKILTHPTLAPEGLVVDVELKAGPNWQDQSEIPLPKMSIGKILTPTVEVIQ